jgi:hypothetical protein
MRTWIPAAVVAVAVAALLVAGAWLGLRQVRAPAAPSPGAGADIHSAEAVMAAVRHYYDVEAEARRTGNADLIDGVTTGPDSLASQNFKRFVAQEQSKNRRSVIVENEFSGWSVTVQLASATVEYVLALRGHDTDLAGLAIESEMTIPKEDYRIFLDLRDARWLVRERLYLGRHAA